MRLNKHGVYDDNETGSLVTESLVAEMREAVSMYQQRWLAICYVTSANESEFVRIYGAIRRERDAIESEKRQ